MRSDYTCTSRTLPQGLQSHLIPSDSITGCVNWKSSCGPLKQPDNDRVWVPLKGHCCCSAQFQWVLLRNVRLDVLFQSSQLLCSPPKSAVSCRGILGIQSVRDGFNRPHWSVRCLGALHPATKLSTHPPHTWLCFCGIGAWHCFKSLTLVSSDVLYCPINTVFYIEHCWTSASRLLIPSEDFFVSVRHEKACLSWPTLEPPALCHTIDVRTALAMASASQAS